MMQINGRITTVHGNADCVARALSPDNLAGMTSTADNDLVTTTIVGTQIRSVIASMDDYLMNLAIADEACSSFTDITSYLSSTGCCQRPGNPHEGPTGSKQKITGRRPSR